MFFNFGSILVGLLSGIFKTVADMYELMLDFATLVSNNSELMKAINGIVDSIYTLIAVFMLFRITVSMIEYLIDPDKLTDKSSGTGKLITRIIISLILLISFNSFIMPKVYDLQTALLESNFINNLFGGTDGENTDGSDGIVFARGIVASLSSKPSEVNNSEFLETKDGNRWLATQVEEEEITLDSFMGIIIGVILICLFAVLCIEVLIREFKLVILQVLAPIAFISYINPNDKVLNNWFQKFVSCFLDLFLKIMGIQIAMFFIGYFKNTLVDSDIPALAVILLYIAAFIFAKTVPNFISDILGIKNMGGTFKESMGAMKNAAFAGADALGSAGSGLIGAGIAVHNVRKAGGSWGKAIGAGALGVGSAATGAVKGLVSGSKGKFGAGTAETWKKNSARNNAYEQGATAGDILRASMLGNFGWDTASRDDKKINDLKQIAKEHQLAADYAKDVKTHVEGELDKGKGDAMVGSQYASKYRKAKEELAALDSARGNITRESVAAGISHEGITDSLYNKIVDDEYNKSLERANKAYQAKHDEFYVNYKGTGKGLKDLAVEEYYNNANDSKLDDKKSNARTKFATYGDRLLDMNIDIWESVDKTGKHHESEANKANAEIYSIENSPQHIASKAAKDATGKKH